MSINFDIKDSEKLIEKIPFKGILAVVTILSVFSLLCPAELLEKLYLLEIRNEIGTYLGITAIICASIWIIIFLSYLIRKISKKIAFNDKNSKKRFERISPMALVTVLEMYVSPTHSIRLGINDATTLILENYLFISRGTISSHGFDFDYFLQPWVIVYLNKHFSEYKYLLQDDEYYEYLD